jgi:hypothetical protein
MKRSRALGRRSLWLVLLLGAGLASSRPALGDTEDGARKHAAKANQLAAKNKCTAAIFEFTRALKTLKDPTLLFNRAECFRKVGRTDEAIRDYEQFLVELPQTPNRAAIEARLAALRGGAGDSAAKEPAKGPPVAAPKEVASAPAKEPAPAPKPPAPGPVAPNPSGTPPSGDPSAKPGTAAAPPAAAPPPAAPEDKSAPPRKADKWTD